MSPSAQPAHPPVAASAPSPPDRARAAPRRGQGVIWMPFVVGALVLAAIWLTFFHSPREAQMGEVYRIFYFHVPSAIITLLLFFTCSLMSVGYLVMRRMRGFGPLAQAADRLAGAMGEIGVLFGIIVLVTGPIWAKPAWGAYWTWEPRLTLTLLTVFLFIGYLTLRGYAAGDETGRRLSAGIATIGAPATYLIHIAVEKWGGNHPTVITGNGGGLAHPDMVTTFVVSLIAIFTLVGYLVFLRYQHHKLRDETEGLFLELSELEDERR